MASGSNVILILNEMPPATLFPLYDLRAGGSTPAEMVPILSFDPSTIQYMDFLCRLEGYNSGGLTFTIEWTSASSSSGVVRWEIAIRKMPDAGNNITAAKTYDYNTVDSTTASAAGIPKYATITFTDGADMDSWANGDIAIVRIRRNASHANDTMTSNAELWSFKGRET